MSFIWIIPSDLPANRAVRPSWQARASIHVTSLGKRGRIAPSTDLLETRAQLACSAHACLQFFSGCCAPTLMMSSLTFAITINGGLAIGYKHPTQQCVVHSCLLPPISFTLGETEILNVIPQSKMCSWQTKAIAEAFRRRHCMWILLWRHRFKHERAGPFICGFMLSMLWQCMQVTRVNETVFATCCLAIWILNIWLWIPTIWLYVKFQVANIRDISHVYLFCCPMSYHCHFQRKLLARIQSQRWRTPAPLSLWMLMMMTMKDKMHTRHAQSWSVWQACGCTFFLTVAVDSKLRIWLRAENLLWLSDRFSLPKQNIA